MLNGRIFGILLGITIEKGKIMRPGIWQIIICVLIIAVLFGAKKIPELARSLGKAKGEFKKGLVEGEKLEVEAEAKKESEEPKQVAEA